MGEYETTIERLNKLLTENGFSAVSGGCLILQGDRWCTSLGIPLEFDSTGKYIKPEKT
jgi:hypothetical protein